MASGWTKFAQNRESSGAAVLPVNPTWFQLGGRSRFVIWRRTAIMQRHAQLPVEVVLCPVHLQVNWHVRHKVGVTALLIVLPHRI